MASSRFAVAVHVLSLLQRMGGGPVASDLIAGSVNTNPVVIRRLVALLVDAGLVRSQSGSGGGVVLARAAEGIRLLDVHRAVEDGDLFAMHRAPNQRCPVGRNIRAELLATSVDAGRAVDAVLARTTIAELAARIASADATRALHAPDTRNPL